MSYIYSNLEVSDYTEGKYDGNWWLSLSRTSKTAYCIGFAGGYYNGEQDGILNVLSKENLDYDKYSNEFIEGSTGKFDGIYVEQLIVNIEEIYEMEKYREIAVSIVVNLALGKIKEEPDDEIIFYLDAELERRANN